MKVIRLEFVSGEHQGQTQSFEQSRIVLGAQPPADILFQDPQVAAHHASIQRTGGQRLMVMDLGSETGTFVGDEAIDAAEIGSGDSIRVGASRMVVHVDSTGDPNVLEEVRQRDSQWRFETLLSQAAANKVPPEKLASFLRVLYDTSRGSFTGDDNIGDAVLQNLGDALPYQTAHVLIADDLGHLRTLSSRHRGTGPEPAPSQTIVARAMRDGTSILTKDAGADRRFSSSESVYLKAIHSAMCVPIFRLRHPVGVIYLDQRDFRHIYRSEDLCFLEALANYLATAMASREMWERMLHAEQLSAVGTVMAHITHDIKSPLAAIAVVGDSLEFETDPEVLGALGREIRSRVEIITDIVDNTLAAVRGSTSRRDDVDVNKLVDVAVALIHSSVRERVAIEVRKQTLPLIEAVPTRLMQVFSNLLRNAADAIEDSGTVEISTRSTETGIEVRVRDDGPGIEAEYLPQLFTPFFTTKEEKGTGLGLAICREIVTQHGGEILVDSTLGEGTTMTVLLPRPADEDD